MVNERFHQSKAGEQKGACTAKNDGYLVLRVPPSYHQNQERYFRVVQSLPMVDTPALRAQRMAAWGKDLLDPKTSGVAALKLEALGPIASETLQMALKSPEEQVRFFAAESLGYLDDPSEPKHSPVQRSTCPSFEPTHWLRWRRWTRTRRTSSYAT